MRVLYVSGEAYPLVKTGGVGRFRGALANAAAEQDVEARVLLPSYRDARTRLAGPPLSIASGSVCGFPLRIVLDRKPDARSSQPSRLPRAFDQIAGHVRLARALIGLIMRSLSELSARSPRNSRWITVPFVATGCRSSQ